MTIRTLLLLTLVSFFSLSTQASNRDVEGLIIRKTDTLHVTLRIPYFSLTEEPDYQSMQNKVKYHDPSGRKLLNAYPEQVMEIQFKHNHRLVRMISFDRAVVRSFSKRSIFLHLMMDGNLQLFQYHFTHSTHIGVAGSPGSGTYYHNSENYVLRKKNGTTFYSNGRLFENKVTTYLADCPRVCEEIVKNRYTRENLFEIANFYNLYCR